MLVSNMSLPNAEAEFLVFIIQFILYTLYFMIHGDTFDIQPKSKELKVIRLLFYTVPFICFIKQVIFFILFSGVWNI